jgi:hypothetical protein
VKDIVISHFAFVLLIIIQTNLQAQEATTQTSERNSKWLKKQDVVLKDEVVAYTDRNPSEEEFELIQTTEPFTQQFDFNDMVRQKMAWDKNLSRENFYLDRCRLSLGVIKVYKVMGGAMLTVKLFD